MPATMTSRGTGMVSSRKLKVPAAAFICSASVDLIDHIKRQTGKKIAAEEFKAVRTVNDVVEAVYRLVQPAA